MASKVLIALGAGTVLLVGGFKLYVQLYRQNLGWTRSLKEKVDGATRSRILNLLSGDPVPERPGEDGGEPLGDTGPL